MAMHEWETIGDMLARMPVPGGWIYSMDRGDRRCSRVFVPEPTRPSDGDKELAAKLRTLAEQHTHMWIDVHDLCLAAANALERIDR